MNHLRIVAMSAAIDFDSQLRTITEEIQHIRPERHLPLEHDSLSARFQSRPQKSLRLRHRFAQMTGQSDFAV